MKVIRTYKLRLYPTSAQVTSLEKFLDQCRWVYNKTLEYRRDSWKNNKKSISLYDSIKMIKKWKKNNSDLAKFSHSQCLQNASSRVNLAFQAFFRRVKSGEAPGYPRFRGRDRYDSFTFPQSGFKLDRDNDLLRVSKVGKIKIVNHRKLKGTVKNLIIRRANYKWYAYFVCEKNAETLPTNSNQIGIDLGVSSFYTDNNGNAVANPKFLSKFINDILRLQRKMSLARNSRNWKLYRKYKKALNKKYERLVNSRTDFAHKLSRKIINENQVICVEDFNIKQMTQKQTSYKNLRKSILDCAWNQFTQFLSYKAEEAGRDLIRVNPRNTTKMCSKCGVLVPKPLSQRKHICNCGCSLDRDHNAAINILRLGLKSLKSKSS